MQTLFLSYFVWRFNKLFDFRKLTIISYVRLYGVKASVDKCFSFLVYEDVLEFMRIIYCTLNPDTENTDV